MHLAPSCSSSALTRPTLQPPRAAASYTKVSLNTEQKINRAGLFGQVGGIACSKEHVYVTDQMRCRVIKCSIIDGSLVQSLGRSGFEDGNFDEPQGLSLSGDGATLFVCDGKNHRVVAVDTAEMSFKYKFGQWGYDAGDLINPKGISSFRDRLLVADAGNNRLSLFTQTGEFLRHIGPDAGALRFAHEPHSVALTDGACFAIESSTSHTEKVPGRIHVIDPDTGARLRPPFQPPFSQNRKNEGLLRDVAVFNGCLYVTSGAGIVMSLPREAPKKDGSEGAGAVPLS